MLFPGQSIYYWDIDGDTQKAELEEKASKIDQIYQDSKKQIKDLGDQAMTLIKTIRGKREKKKIEEITKDLKS